MKTEKGWTAMVISGSEKGLQRAGRRLGSLGYPLFTTSQYRAVVDDVRESSLPALQAVVAECGCSIEALQDEKEIALPRAAQPRPKRAFRLNLDEGKWYFAENAEDIYPLVFVRKQEIVKQADDQGDEREVQTFLLELFNPEDGMPYRIDAESKHVSRLGLRPATIEDFEELDMIPPEFGELAVVTAAPDPKPRTAAAKNFGRLRKGGAEQTEQRYASSNGEVLLKDGKVVPPAEAIMYRGARYVLDQ